MKRIFLPMFIAIMAISFVYQSCSKQEDNIDDNVKSSQSVELAFPDRDAEKELLILPNGLIVEKLDSIYILGGDMILPNSYVESLYKDSIITKAAAINEFCKFWPNGRVYYEFASNMTSTYRTAALNGMKMWQDKTGVEFIPTTTGNRVYIQYSPSSNSSALGYIKNGKQNLLLANASAGIAAHELGHAIGLIHEHQRPNRGNYITVKTNNIKPEKRHNFDLVPSAISCRQEMDYNSIMMYSSYNSFAIDLSLPTMTRKDGTTWEAQRTKLSDSDIELVKFIYGPPFYSIKKEVIRDNSREQGNVEIIDVEYSNRIYFYSDKQCKNRISQTENPVQVRLKRFRKYKQYGYQPVFYSETFIYNIPAGTSSWALPDTKEYRMYELANETNCDISDYFDYCVKNVDF